MEQNLVVFFDRKIDVSLNLHAHFNHTSGDCRNLGVIGQHNTASCLMSSFVFADQHPHSQRFHVLVHEKSPLQKCFYGSRSSGSQDRLCEIENW